MDLVNLSHVRLKEMLEAIARDVLPSDNGPEGASEKALNQLNYRRCNELRHAWSSKARRKNTMLFFEDAFLPCLAP
jgi:hypothetical protein